MGNPVFILLPTTLPLLFPVLLSASKSSINSNSMRYLYVFLLGILLTFEAAAQKTSAQRFDSVNTENVNQNLYTFRKYSFSLAVNPYTNISHGGGNYLFGATEVMFSDRIKW